MPIHVQRLLALDMLPTAENHHLPSKPYCDLALFSSGASSGVLSGGGRFAPLEVGEVFPSLPLTPSFIGTLTSR